MLSITNDTRVGRFWDYPIENINNQTIDKIQIIVRIREKALAKVKTGEWTEEEYKDFSTPIKSLTIQRFIEFIDIVDVFLSFSKLEVCTELSNLLNKGFLILDCKNKSVNQIMISVILEIQAKLFSISNTTLIEEENNKEMGRDLSERIKFYEQLLLQVQDPNSDYINLLKDIFRNWVEENFQNERLKETILKQEFKIIKRKEKNVKASLKKIIIINNQKALEAEKYFAYQARITNDKKAMKKAINR